MTNKELHSKSQEVRKKIFKFKTQTGNGHLASCLLIDTL